MRKELLVISGGQDGVDIAALRAAKKLGIPTGGMLPLGCKTQSGPRIEYLTLYGMTEHQSFAYPPRTEWNVKHADATLRIANDFNSAGEKCTLRFIQKHKKPYFDVNFDYLDGLKDGTTKIQSLFHVAPIIVVEWLLSQRVRTLNVAGNSERTCPKIEYWTERYLALVFSQWIIHLSRKVSEAER